MLRKGNAQLLPVADGASLSPCRKALLPPFFLIKKVAPKNQVCAMATPAQTGDADCVRAQVLEAAAWRFMNLIGAVLRWHFFKAIIPELTRNKALHDSAIILPR